jgi:hypothetical protein
MLGVPRHGAAWGRCANRVQRWGRVDPDELRSDEIGNDRRERTASAAEDGSRGHSEHSSEGEKNPEQHISQ